MTSTCIGCKRIAQRTRAPVAARRSLVARSGAERVKDSKKGVIVSPSILSANFAELGSQVCPSRVDRLNVSGTRTLWVASASRALAPSIPNLSLPVTAIPLFASQPIISQNLLYNMTFITFVIVRGVRMATYQMRAREQVPRTLSLRTFVPQTLIRLPWNESRALC